MEQIDRKVHNALTKLRARVRTMEEFKAQKLRWLNHAAETWRPLIEQEYTQAWLKALEIYEPELKLTLTEKLIGG